MISVCSLTNLMLHASCRWNITDNCILCRKLWNVGIMLELSISCYEQIAECAPWSFLKKWKCQKTQMKLWSRGDIYVAFCYICGSSIVSFWYLHLLILNRSHALCTSTFAFFIAASIHFYLYEFSISVAEVGAALTIALHISPFNFRIFPSQGIFLYFLLVHSFFLHPCVHFFSPFVYSS